MVGFFPILPKLPGISGDPFTEVGLPEAVDDDAGGERVLGVGDPVGEGGAAAGHTIGDPYRRIPANALKHRKHPRRDGLGGRLDVTARQNVNGRGAIAGQRRILQRGTAVGLAVEGPLRRRKRGARSG
jgi:hypothetical protein